jgi:hypothetical protein
VRAFFDGLNQEVTTGDDSAVVATYGAHCGLCATQVLQIKAAMAGGRTLRGDLFHVLSIDSARASSGNLVSVVVTETQDAGQQVDARGTVLQSFPAFGPTKLDFEVATDSSPPRIWLVGQVTK